MKKMLFFMTVIGLVSCAKPVILKNKVPIISNTDNPCIRFHQTLDNEQPVRAKAKQEKVLYYYNLNEFLGDLRQGVCNEHSAIIKNISVLAGFITVRAAVSLNRFQIEVIVETNNPDISMNEKTYKTEIDSEELFFLTSGGKKQNNKDSVALRKGLKNILDQIALDLKNTNEQ